MFTTMLCLGIDLAVAVFDVFSSRSRSAFFLLVSWGLPAVIVAISLGGSQLEGYGDETYFWLRHTTLFGFIVPVLCIVLVNLTIVIFVMRRIYTSSFMMKKSLKEKNIEWTEGSMWAAANIRPYLGFWNIFRESGSNNFPVFVCSFQFPSGSLHLSVLCCLESTDARSSCEKD